MNNYTQEKFGKRIKQFIDHICNKSKENRLYFDEDKFKLVFSYYEEYRSRIHDFMHISSKKMDRHKVATAFFCSIIKAKPIGYNRVGSMPNFVERTANEHLGFIFGLDIIYRFNFSNTNVSALDKEIYGLSIKLPECKNNNDDEYTTHFIKLVYDKKVKDKLDFRHQEFSIFLLFFMSHIFFLIDSFSYYKNYKNLHDNT